MAKKIDFKPININTYEGVMPAGYDLVIVEKSLTMNDEYMESATVLYGFDEVGMFDKHFTEPQYGFLKFY